MSCKRSVAVTLRRPTPAPPPTTPTHLLLVRPPPPACIVAVFSLSRPSVSPQICTRASSQGLRPPSLLTCSLLSQVTRSPSPAELRPLSRSQINKRINSLSCCDLAETASAHWTDQCSCSLWVNVGDCTEIITCTQRLKTDCYLVQCTANARGVKKLFLFTTLNKRNKYFANWYTKPLSPAGKSPENPSDFLLLERLQM